MLLIDISNKIKKYSIEEYSIDVINFKYIKFNINIDIVNKATLSNNKMIKFMYYKYLKYVLNKVSNICNKESINEIVLSKKLTSSKNKDILKTILSSLEIHEMILTKENNTIMYNSFKYIKDLDPKLKILCITNNNISTEILLEYMSKFKKVDILYNNSSIDTKFLNEIERINNEYGTSASFIKNNDISTYDIYMIFDDIDLSYYKLNKRAKIIPLISSENDIYSYEYIIYNKYKSYIDTLEEYNKNILGSILYKHLTHSV